MKWSWWFYNTNQEVKSKESTSVISLDSLIFVFYFKHLFAKIRKLIVFYSYYDISDQNNV